MAALSPLKRLPCLLTALLAAVPLAASAQISISDGDFGAWSFDATGSATVTREAVGGNPGARLNITTVSGTTVSGTAIKQDFSSSDRLVGSAFELSIEVASGPGGFGQGQGIQLLIEQGESVYGSFLGITGWPLSYDPVTFEGVLDAGSFERLIGEGPPSPNLDGGTPTRFGFAGGNTNSGTLTQFYDNFELSVTPPTPTPALGGWGLGLVAVALGGLALLALGRQDARTR